jgi:hypothetical protein
VGVPFIGINDYFDPIHKTFVHRSVIQHHECICHNDERAIIYMYTRGGPFEEVGFKICELTVVFIPSH